MIRLIGAGIRMPRPAGGDTLRGLALAGLGALALAGPAGASDEPPIEVRIEGVEGRMLENVRRLLSIHRLAERADLDEERVRALYRRAPAEIREALEALGHYRARVEASLAPEGDRWIARFEVDPGPPLPVRARAIELRGPGRDDDALEAAVSGFPLSVGDPLDHGRYAGGKRELERVAAERGYFEGGFVESRIAVDLEAYAADITIVYATGPRYRFGPVHWPETVVSDALVSRYLRLHEGDPYLASALLATETALRNSDYFSQVRAQALRDQAVDGAVPVEITLEPREPNRYSAGLGFGTDTGPRARLGWDRRYLTRGGHRLRTELRVSPVIGSLSGRYAIPTGDPATDEWSLGAALRQEDTDTRRSRKAVLGAARSVRRGEWRETISLDYEVEDFDVSTDDDTQQLLVPGVEYSRIWAEDPLHVRNGLRVRASLRGSHEAVTSAVSFLQARLQAKLIRSLAHDWRVLLRGALGATATGDFEDLPGSYRFFAGGDTSIRGFDYEALGPENAQGEVVGGRYLGVGSVELERHIAGNWSGAVFLDFGNAFDTLSDSRIEYGAGFGLRWRSPIGPVRVDLASGVSDPDAPVRLHVVIGPDL